MSLRLLRVLPVLALLLSGCTPQIGNKCTLSTDCSQLGDRLCDTNQPGGYCTVFNCEPDQCPNAICVAFDPLLDPACGSAADGRWPRFERSFCLAPCNSSGDCRAQYDCVDLSVPANETLRRAQVVDQYTTTTGPNGEGGFGYKVCMASTCGDGIQDGAETDVDCGGPSCPACGSGLRCGAATDCASGNCLGNLCLGNQACLLDTDCSSGVCNGADPLKGCPAGVTCYCSGTNCTDKVRDGAETDVDCGGPDCARCVSTATVLFGCTAASDCASDICLEMGTTTACPAGVSIGTCVCSPGDCTDGKLDGVETDVDCGGGGCQGCSFGQACKASTDCKSNLCVAGKCAAPPVCSVPSDAGAPWVPYQPDSGAGGAGTGGSGPSDAGDGG